jgi:hypothetical protein
VCYHTHCQGQGRAAIRLTVPAPATRPGRPVSAQGGPPRLSAPHSVPWQLALLSAPPTQTAGNVVSQRENKIKQSLNTTHIVAAVPWRVEVSAAHTRASRCLGMRECSQFEEEAMSACSIHGLSHLPTTKHKTNAHGMPPAASSSGPATRQHARPFLRCPSEYAKARRPFRHDTLPCSVPHGSLTAVPV